MVKITNKHALLGLLIFLAIVLMVSPAFLQNMYGTILGRVLLIVIIIFCAIHNTTLGLLAALIFIIVSGMYMTEGMDNMTSTNTTTANGTTTTTGTTTTGNKTVTVPSGNTVSYDPSNNTLTGASGNTVQLGKIVGNIKARANAAGVDRQTIQQNIQAKSSSTMPPATTTSTTEPTPATTTATTTQESFKGMGGMTPASATWN